MKKFIRFSCLLMVTALCFSFCACTQTLATTETCDNGHDLVQVGYAAPTCQTVGAKVYTCSRCGYTETQTLFPIDCDYQEKSTTPSTCTEQGTQILECSMCHAQKMETLPLKEHNYVQQSTTLPTCLQFGKTTKKCSGCGDERIEFDNVLLPHNFDETGFCTECGISNHYFDEDLHIRWFNALGEITIDLTPLFNNSSINTADHWVTHTVFVILTLYYSYEDDSPIILQYDSKTNEKQCFWSFEDESKTTPLHFSATLGNLINYLHAYTITIECEGFEAISQTYYR